VKGLLRMRRFDYTKVAKSEPVREVAAV
jgi:hypothetical protein